MDEQTQIGPTRFFEWLTNEEYGELDLREPLTPQTAPGETARHETPLMRKAAEAEAQPLQVLTCEQVRFLTSQKIGLERLSRPITAFVARYPKAEVTFFPGDLTAVAFRAFPELLTHAPEQAREMARTDLAWMVSHWRDIDRDFSNEIERMVESARELARSHR